ncbi:thioesterase II family protein [Streptomyces sp. RKAG337]|uniref:thioesterase II family protein n=1 Tax=Streptomyces sp. RKAG337 TaxID=2893404 RepID=UPI0020332651|nr:alpha/beta fold hydrolase [Streptomyces sp. RKAG337]MCM2425081.1 alpha/beta fold hydrolase [Streptomyces sp. RKAG337]
MSPSTGRSAVNDQESWFNYVVTQPEPRRRLLCLGGAASGPSEFVTWSEALPPDTELWPVQLPGRERRLREKPYTDLTALLTGLTAALERTDAATPLPLILFGHSFGALVMYELARSISARWPHRLQGLIVSGQAAPGRPARHQQISRLDDTDLLHWLRHLGGTPSELLDEAWFANWLLRDVRASYRIGEAYTVTPEPPLTCPVTALGGQDDFEADAEDLAAWERLTTGRFRSHMLPGGHFFLRTQRTPLLRILRQELHELSRTET